MKFEFVEFYPNADKIDKKSKKGHVIGTVHVYMIDQDIDLRGILVIQYPKGLLFAPPHVNSIDETGKKVRYPVFRFLKEENHKSFIDYLRQVVRPIVEQHLNASRSKKTSGAV